MTDRVKEIGKSTALPLGIVIACLGAAFYFGGIHTRVQTNTENIAKNATSIEKVIDGVRRLEIHFGTLPKDQVDQ